MRLAFPVLALSMLASALACSSSSDNTCSSTASALSVCAKGTVVKGVDVSIYQGTVDWTKAKSAGVEFAIARVSDGTGNPDTQFAANWPNMKKAGVLRGTYQFFRPGEDPMGHASLASVLTFSEMNRLQVFSKDMFKDEKVSGASAKRVAAPSPKGFLIGATRFLSLTLNVAL